ncbi:adenylate kinase [Murdochiella vaginalis]|uniref:adenylate kinase n=1 Tax=Murdochiella vaginalis TaxID=1852373 RepID=UPI0008FE2DF2|nr:adenylate kinase [Murdochiella vaginalis]
MRLVLLGPPGAGKGTQAKMLEERYHLSHISTGDIFRANIKNQTELGKKVESYLSSGQLVPDELTIAMLWDRLDREGDKGFLLDGFPRTLEQADALKAGLAKRACPLDAVISIEVEEKVLVKRLAGRRTCPQCGASFHITDQPPQKEGICDVCGTSLIQRTDDTEETVQNRIAVYRKQTEPLVAYYDKEGILVHINGDQPVESVFHAIEEALTV